MGNFIPTAKTGTAIQAAIDEAYAAGGGRVVALAHEGGIHSKGLNAAHVCLFQHAVQSVVLASRGCIFPEEPLQQRIGIASAQRRGACNESAPGKGAYLDSVCSGQRVSDHGYLAARADVYEHAAVYILYRTEYAGLIVADGYRDLCAPVCAEQGVIIGNFGYADTGDAK